MPALCSVPGIAYYALNYACPIGGYSSSTTATSHVTHVSVSGSSDSEQPTESSDISQFIIAISRLITDQPFACTAKISPIIQTSNQEESARKSP